jgi:hypothetical protein
MTDEHAFGNRAAKGLVNPPMGESFPIKTKRAVTRLAVLFSVPTTTDLVYDVARRELV